MICGPGEVSDVDRAIAIFLPAHLICIFPDESVSCTVYGRTGIVEPTSRQKRIAKVAGRRIVERERIRKMSENRGAVPTEAHGSTLQRPRNHIFGRRRAGITCLLPPAGRARLDRKFETNAGRAGRDVCAPENKVGH